MRKKNDIFGVYDIRGKYPREIDEKAAEEVALSFLDLLREYRKKKIRIVLGRDKSKHSLKIYKIIKEALMGEGGVVLDLGLATTPFLNWVTGKESASGGIMVTASHLGEDFVGFKLCGKEARPITPAKLKLISKKGRIVGRKSAGYRIFKKNWLGEYAKFLKRKFNIEKNFKIAIDASGGTAARILKEVFSGISEIKIKKLNFGNSSHGDNPLDKKNYKDVKKEMDSGKFDFGVMFDGDGDRIVFFNKKGEFILPDYILAILAKDLIKNNSVFVGDLTLSRIVKERVLEKGGKFLESRRGHVFIKEKMRRKEAVLGGEASGHIYFKEMYFCESGILTLLKILEILEKENKNLEEVIFDFKKYWKMKERNFSLSANRVQKIIDKIKNKYKDGRISEIDGVRVEYSDWWFNLRFSNTEDLARLNLEAKDKELGEKKLKEILRVLK